MDKANLDEVNTRPRNQSYEVVVVVVVVLVVHGSSNSRCSLLASHAESVDQIVRVGSSSPNNISSSSSSSNSNALE